MGGTASCFSGVRRLPPPSPALPPPSPAPPYNHVRPPCIMSSPAVPPPLVARPGPLVISPRPISVNAIPADELREATNDFGIKNQIAVGSDISVYYGVLRSGRPVAIRKIHSSCKLPKEEFLAQLAVLSRIKHENIVELVGFHVDQSLNHALVYEFAAMRSLRDVLHGGNGGKAGIILSWAQRLKIAAGAAMGLQYLHEKGPPIVHNHIKASNVLLFDNDVAKLADFDLSNSKQSADMSRAFGSTAIIGDFGYRAPELALIGQGSSSSDVYSFGVVMLELLTGCKPNNKRLPREKQSLVQWAGPMLTVDVRQCVDPRLRGNYAPDAAAKMARVISLCIQYRPNDRPNMRYVAEQLAIILRRHSRPVVATPRP